MFCERGFAASWPPGVRCRWRPARARPRSPRIDLHRLEINPAGSASRNETSSSTSSWNACGTEEPTLFMMSRNLASGSPPLGAIADRAGRIRQRQLRSAQPRGLQLEPQQSARATFHDLSGSETLAKHFETDRRPNALFQKVWRSRRLRSRTPVF